MVKVASSSGGFVQVEVKGVAEAIEVIRKKGKDVVDGTDAKVFQAANALQQEIQESIIGNRAEPKSVDTGTFANSIEVGKKELNKYSISTDVEYAKFLEYGTSRLEPRNHFRNSLSRMRVKILEILKAK